MFTFLRKYYFLLIIVLVLLFFINFFKSASVAFPPVAFNGRSNLNQEYVKVAAGKQYQRNKIFTFFFGSHYREIWSKEIFLKKINVGKFRHNFSAVETGGNLQTLSLKIRSKSQRSYSLRTVDKDQSKVLPEFLKKTFLTDILRDQTSALFPYGAPIVANLAEQAGVLHTNPHIFYFPKTTASDQFWLVQDKIVLLEEAPDESWNKESKFYHCSDFISTPDFVKTLFEGKLLVKTDTFQFLKTRLFDFLIGDWDRHSGQWKWGKKRIDSSFYFLPFPKDRDMAFYLFNDGLINKVALWFVPKLQTFNKKYENIEALAFNGKYLDQLLLSTLPEQKFLEASNSLQTSLTNEKIQASLHYLPKEMPPALKSNLFQTLIERREKLQEAAKSYFYLLSESPVITGTDLAESFTVKRLKDSTMVEIYMKEHKNPHKRTYTFKNSLTQFITIYCFGGNDEILIKGNSEKAAPVLKIYLGSGKDTVRDISFVQGLLKKNWIYDSVKGCKLFTGKDTKDIRTILQPEELNREGTR